MSAPRRPIMPAATRRAGFVLEQPHTPETEYHAWVYVPNYQGASPVVYRDWLGRKGASSYRWLWLICNNTECAAVALVRLGPIEDLAEEHLPVPKGSTP